MNRAIHHHAMYIILMIFFVIVAVFTNTNLFYNIFLSQSIIVEDQLSFSKKLFENFALDRYRVFLMIELMYGTINTLFLEKNFVSKGIFTSQTSYIFI